MHCTIEHQAPSRSCRHLESYPEGQTFITSESAKKTHAYLLALLKCPYAVTNPHALRRNIVGPVLTNRATIEFLKRKAPLAALKDACTAQLKNLQVELEAIYEKDGLGNALGTLGADVASRSSKKKSAVARQDSDGLLPTISGTGLTEDGYVHVCTFSESPSTPYSTKTCELY